MGKSSAAARAVLSSRSRRRKASALKIANKSQQKQPKQERKAQNKSKAAKLAKFEGIHKSAAKAMEGLQWKSFKQSVLIKTTDASATRRSRGGKRQRKKTAKSRTVAREEKEMKSVDFSTYDRIIPGDESSDSGSEAADDHVYGAGLSKRKLRVRRKSIAFSDEDIDDAKLVASEELRRTPFSWADEKTKMPTVGSHAVGFDDDDEDMAAQFVMDEENEEQSKDATEESEPLISTEDISRLLTTAPGADMRETEDDEEDDDSDDDEDTEMVDMSASKRTSKRKVKFLDESRKLTKEQWTVQRMDRVKKLKLEIADICCRVLEDPYIHVAMLPLIWKLCTSDPDTSIMQCAMLSLTKVICDVMPPYKIGTLPGSAKPGSGVIRGKEAETRIGSDGKRVQLKDSTAQVRNFEQTLLSVYSSFLKFCVSRTKVFRDTNGEKQRNKSVKRYMAGKCAVKCLSLFLQKGAHFNYTKTLIQASVPLLNSPSAEVRALAHSGVVAVLSVEPTNAVTVECVANVCKRIRACNYSDCFPECVTVFVHLPMRYLETPSLTMEDIRKEEMAGVKKSKSKFERKLEKKLDKELREMDILEADEGMKRKRDFILQKAILENVFEVYFFILKLEDTNHKLLPCALEGMARFGHLVNVELVLDLVMVVSSKLKAEKWSLSMLSKLHCVKTCVGCMEGRGAYSSIEIDLLQHYNTLFECLMQALCARRTPKWSKCMDLLFDCLELVFLKRKSVISAIPALRSMAFAKRLCTAALHLPPHFALAAMQLVRKMIAADPRLYAMLECNTGDANDYHSQVSAALQSYAPHAANASETLQSLIGGVEASAVLNPGFTADHFHQRPDSVFELQTNTRHFQPFTRLFAADLQSWSEIPMKLSSQKPRQLCAIYDSSEDGHFRPDVKWKKALFRSEQPSAAIRSVPLPSRKQMVDWFSDSLPFALKKDGKRNANLTPDFCDDAILRFCQTAELSETKRCLQDLEHKYEDLIEALHFDE